MVDHPNDEPVWQSREFHTPGQNDSLPERKAPVTSQGNKSQLPGRIRAVVTALSIALAEAGASDGGSLPKKENDRVGKMSAIDTHQIEAIGQHARKEHDVMKKNQHGRYEANIHLRAKNEPTEAEWRMLLTTVPPGSYSLYFGDRDNGGMVEFYIPEDGRELIFLHGYYPQPDQTHLPIGGRRKLIYKSIEKQSAAEDKKKVVLTPDQKEAKAQEDRVYGELIQEAGDMHVFEEMGLKKGTGITGLNVSEVISKEMLDRAVARLAMLSPGFQGRVYHIEIPLEGRKYKGLGYRVDLDGTAWFLGERAVWLNRPSGFPLNYQPPNPRMEMLRQNVIRRHLNLK